MRRGRARWSLVLLTALASAACGRPSDCKFYETCADSLVHDAKKLAGSTADACESCLEACQGALSECNESYRCIYTSKCMLTRSPEQHQSCLLDLFQAGYTRGDEKGNPWQALETGQDGLFARCLFKSCREQCVSEPFVCDDDSQQYSRRFNLRVAVRTYPGFKLATGVRVSVCDENGCHDSTTADDAGIAVLEYEPVRVLQEEFHFQIEARVDGPDKFPFTRYYPGRLGEDDEQLVAVFVMTTNTISQANSILFPAPGSQTVLKDAGQSLVLPDSCVWEETSPDKLRIDVKDAAGNLVEQCHELPNALDDAGVFTPCVWYARDRTVARAYQQTDGNGGAGVIGLGDGLVTVTVKQEDNTIIAQRTIRMEPGTMTIARTWPLPKRDQRVAEPQSK